MLGSFKIKLVGTFLALSVVPLAAAFWGFSAVAERSVTSGVDDRLEAGLNAALAAFEDERQNAEAAAQRLGKDRQFQACAREPRSSGDREDAAALAAAAGRDTGRVRRRRGPAACRRDDGRPRRPGRPFRADHRLGAADPGARRGGCTPAPVSPQPDELVFVDKKRQVGAASKAGVSGTTQLVPGRVETSLIGDHEYRAIGTRLVPESTMMLAAVTPSSVIASEKQSVLGRLLVGLIGSLLLIACVAYLAGRSIVGALGRLADAAHSIAAGRLEERVEVRGRDEFAQLGRAFNQMASQLEGRLEDLEDERRRLRDANARFGDALASSLDPEQLRRVIVESAVEATQADGGVVIAEDGSYVETGDVGGGGERLDFELTSGRRSFGRLLLVGDDFDAEERMTAASLAGQAVVALENARLHRMVERQALVDGLTGLANRRQADEALASEIARTERLGGPVGLILADVDDFKAVNDRFGHPTGDVVLRDLAETLLENVREIDTAARWGGEEFAVILPGTDLEGTAQVAERIRAALADREILSVDGVALHVTASFGVATSNATTTVQQLVEAADEALYRAKRAGKDRVYAGTDPVTRL